jgi:hypothetical protein
MSSTPDSSGTAAEPNPLIGLVRLRWKHALVFFTVGTATYALYGLGGLTVDTAVFGFLTLVILLYSVVTYRSDVR